VNVRIQDGSFYFDFKNANLIIEDIQLGLPGLHNIENAVAAIEVALHLGIDPEKQFMTPDLRPIFISQGNILPII
jgi:UDP-N-acetylmuramate--alanine ligase